MVSYIVISDAASCKQLKPQYLTLPAFLLLVDGFAIPLFIKINLHNFEFR